MRTVEAYLGFYGYAIERTCSGRPWAIRHTPTAFTAISNYDGLDIPSTLTEPIIISGYDVNDGFVWWDTVQGRIAEFLLNRCKGDET